MKKYNLQEIGIDKEIELSDLRSFPTSLIPRYLQKTSYTNIEAIDHGSYGEIFKAQRTKDDETRDLLIKQPKISEMNLTQEAIIQHIAHKHLQSFGCDWAIPKVYDVFLNKKGVCFTMDYIQGQLVSDWIQSMKGPQIAKLFYLFLAQVSLLLWLLEEHLNLDHRDLKANNLLIRNEPCQIKILLLGHQWTLNCPFQVILLDFGFACIGDLVNLGDGVLPKMDPCPKEGRDLFHLFVSILGLSAAQTNFPPALIQRIEKWMEIGSKSYGEMARKWATENWVHLVTSERKFANPSCKPETILRTILPELPGSLFFE